jgi:putative MFS transporter
MPRRRAFGLDVSTEKDRGRWTGLYQTWFFVGAALGSFSGGLLTDWIGYAPTLWIGAGVTAIGGLVALILLPETRSLGSGTGRCTEQARPRLRANRDLWAVASLYGVNRFVLSGLFGATLALLVQDRLAILTLGIATLTGILSAGRTALSMASAPLAGILSDRLERWPIAAWAALGAAIGMALVAWGTPAAILSGIALGALASGGIQALVTALIGDVVSTEQRGRAIGLVHSAGDLGSATGPLVAYAVLPWAGLRSIYLCGAALFVVQLGLIAHHARRQKHIAAAPARP